MNFSTVASQMLKEVTIWIVSFKANIVFNGIKVKKQKSYLVFECVSQKWPSPTAMMCT